MFNVSTYSYVINPPPHRHTSRLAIVMKSTSVCTTDARTQTPGSDRYRRSAPTPVLSCVACVEVSDRKGGGVECPLGVLIMAPLLPLAVTVPGGGRDKRKAMFHLCCLGISNSEGSRGERGGALCRRKRRNPSDASSLSSVSPFICLLLWAVFKIRHLIKAF